MDSMAACAIVVVTSANADVFMAAIARFLRPPGRSVPFMTLGAPVPMRAKVRRVMAIATNIHRRGELVGRMTASACLMGGHIGRRDLSRNLTVATRTT